MVRLETELQHMLRMLAPPFFNAWKEEIERKAKALESSSPEYSGLWNRVRAEVRARGWHKPTPPSTSPGP